jgi:hypothetical protein
VTLTVAQQQRTECVAVSSAKWTRERVITLWYTYIVRLVAQLFLLLCYFCSSTVPKQPTYTHVFHPTACHKFVFSTNALFYKYMQSVSLEMSPSLEIAAGERHNFVLIHLIKNWGLQFPGQLCEYEMPECSASYCKGHGLGLRRSGQTSCCLSRRVWVQVLAMMFKT